MSAYTRELAFQWLVFVTVGGYTWWLAWLFAPVDPAEELEVAMPCQAGDLRNPNPATEGIDPQ